MLHKISLILAKKLVQILGEEKEDIYIYGLELIISIFLSISSILFFQVLYPRRHQDYFFDYIYSITPVYR